MVEHKKATKKVAPYASVKAMSQFFRTVRGINPPDRVDAKFLRIHGIGPRNEWSVVHAVRFLGLVDDEGIPTENFTSIQVKGAAFQDNLKTLIGAAYADLFNTFGALPEDKQKLQNFFVENYSPATAKKATVCFIGLCREAGMELPEGLGLGAPPKVGEAKKPKRPNERPTRVIPPKAERQVALEPGELFTRYVERLIEQVPKLEFGPGTDAEAIRAATEARERELAHIERLLASMGVTIPATEEGAKQD